MNEFTEAIANLLELGINEELASKHGNKYSFGFSFNADISKSSAEAHGKALIELIKKIPEEKLIESIVELITRWGLYLDSPTNYDECLSTFEKIKICFLSKN